MNAIAVGIWIVAALSSAPAGGDKGGGKNNAETKPAETKPAEAVDKDALATYLRHGRSALELSKWPAAHEAFRAAIKVDPKCADAHHGAGIAAYAGGNQKAAVEHLEKACSLYDPPNRAALFNLATAHLKTSPMRTAKLAKDYLSRPDAEADEQFHNLLGRALFYVAGPQARQAALWKEAKDFYLRYNASLAERRTDGRKRWGSEWVPAAVADARWSQIEARITAVERLRTELVRAQARAKKAHNDRYEMGTDMRLYSSREKRAVNQRYVEAMKAEASTKAQYTAAQSQLSQVEKPPLPQTFRMRPMDGSVEPAPETQVGAAAATGRANTAAGAATGTAPAGAAPEPRAAARRGTP